ncbi:MAG: tetratricopeptide repeat protein [Rhodobacteraceae bacterium]|nr:tetratricopeptide repeat protein [Paracoccaceae bacterium]
MRPLTARLLASVVLGICLAAPVVAEQNPGAYLAARSAALDRNYAEAAVWFGLALEDDPGNIGLMEGVVQSRIGLGDFAGAARTAQALIDAGEAGQGAPIVMLVARADAGDYAAILADTSGAGVGTLYDQLTKAWAEVGNGRMTEALASFDALAAAPGLEAFGLYHKALALASVGDYEGADAILSGAAAGPINLMRRGTIAHVQILSQLERNPDALAVMEAAFGTAPDPALDALRARLQAGEPVPYDITRNAKDGLAEALFTIAGALNAEADDTFTLVYARAAAHLRPDNTEAVLLVAGLLENLRQYDLAASTYAAVPAADPAFFIAEIGRAESMARAGKDEAALEVLQALSRSQPDNIAVHMALADALRRSERWADAIVSYDAALALIETPDAGHWPLYYSRGVSHERLQNWDAAEADFRQALALNPDQPQVLNYLGYSFVDRGENLDEALTLIERAVALDPDAGYIIDSLAWAYFRMGRFEDAVAPMEKASLLEPVDPVVTDHLGDVYWAVGRTREAQFQWRRALSFNPTEKDAIRIRRKLEVGLDVVRIAEGADPIRPVAQADAPAPLPATTAPAKDENEGG